MRTPETWREVLHIEDQFLALEAAVLAGRLDDYRQVPPQAFAWHAWDQLDEERFFRLARPFLARLLARAGAAMPGLYPAASLPEAAQIRTREDWWAVPILVKDDLPELGLRGFRQHVSRQPAMMKPADARLPLLAFGSGGSLGSATPTFVSLDDREREVQAWRRGHAYHGLLPGDIALYTYNTAHKGGQWMQESLARHGLDVHLRRPEDGPEQVLESLRRYQANVLFTVQQPAESLGQQAKSAGINLHALIQASLENPHTRGILLPDRHGRRQIEFLFLGGFAIADYALELVREYLADLPVATLLGSSEAIPQACSTNPRLTPGAACHYNQLHLLQGPHYIEVVKPESGRWIPVRKGETGLLVYTSWARDGTLWIRYAPGDIAAWSLDAGECPCGLRSPVISGVQRKDARQNQELLLYGCAAG